MLNRFRVARIDILPAHNAKLLDKINEIKVELNGTSSHSEACFTYQKSGIKHKGYSDNWITSFSTF